MSGADEGTIIHVIAFFLGGSIRWVVKGRKTPYLSFVKSEKEMNLNLKWGYAIFFLMLSGLSAFWYFAFRPGKQ